MGGLVGVITTGDITDGNYLYETLISTSLKTISFQNSQHANQTHKVRLFLEHKEKKSQKSTKHPVIPYSVYQQIYLCLPLM